LFFWQASQEVEEAIADNKIPDIGIGTPAVSRKNVADMHWDTIIGRFFLRPSCFLSSLPLPQPYMPMV